MKKWELKPLESIGEIKFGMNRDDVHKLFEDKCTEFKKTKFSQNTSDDYKNFHIFYTSDNKVDAVEFFEDVEIILEGQEIFPIPIGKIETAISGISREGESYTHIEKSIGIETNSGKVESILVGSKGYFG